MRDKNLTYSQFNIQLKRNLKEVTLFSRFLRRAVIDSPTFRWEDYKIVYPKDFRSIRSLAIIQWYLPESLHWRILMDLQDKSFSQLNSKQRIEIQILLSSQENMTKFLFETERYSSYEIFGNILKNDKQDLEKYLKIYRKNYKVVKSQRKRGYDDKGSRKPDWKWLPDSDFSFTEYQNEKERKQNLEFKTFNRINQKLRTLIEVEDLD